MKLIQARLIIYHIYVNIFLGWVNHGTAVASLVALVCPSLYANSELESLGALAFTAKQALNANRTCQTKRLRSWTQLSPVAKIALRALTCCNEPWDLSDMAW